MNKKGQVSIYVAFIIAAVFIVIISAVFAPMGVKFNTEMYRAGEKILASTNESIAQIQNETIRTEVMSAIHTAQLASVDNIEINADIFQYGWVVIIILVGLIVFLYTRRLTELGAGGLV